MTSCFFMDSAYCVIPTSTREDSRPYSVPPLGKVQAHSPNPGHRYSVVRDSLACPRAGNSDGITDGHTSFHGATRNGGARQRLWYCFPSAKDTGHNPSLYVRVYTYIRLAVIFAATRTRTAHSHKSIQKNQPTTETSCEQSHHRTKSEHSILR
jgi:hypothetical protein